jgi:hypothetical protein
MAKPQIRSIITHFVHDEHPLPLSERIDDLHVQVIERRLAQLGLSNRQKVNMIDRIIANLKPSEIKK